MLEDFWKDYYKNGVIPNIWKGITGQQSADLQAENQLGIAREQMLQADKQFNAQMDLAKMNFNQQQAQFDYQKQLNELQISREDNAMQRRVADLKKAGLSPLMATEGAQAGNLLSAPAPQMNADSAFSNRAAAYADAYNRKFQASQFRQQMSLQTAQLAADVMSKMLSTATQIPSMLSTNDQRKWNNEHGWRNMTLGSEIINAVEKLFSGFNKSSVSPSLGNLGTSVSKVIKDIGETMSNNISSSSEDSKNNLIKYTLNENNNVPKYDKRKVQKELDKMQSSYEKEYAKRLNELSKDPDNFEKSKKVWLYNTALQRDFSPEEFYEWQKDDSNFNSLFFNKNKYGLPQRRTIGK